MSTPSAEPTATKEMTEKEGGQQSHSDERRLLKVSCLFLHLGSDLTLSRFFVLQSLVVPRWMTSSRRQRPNLLSTSFPSTTNKSSKRRRKRERERKRKKKRGNV